MLKSVRARAPVPAWASRGWVIAHAEGRDADADAEDAGDGEACGEAPASTGVQNGERERTPHTKGSPTHTGPGVWV